MGDLIQIGNTNWIDPDCVDMIRVWWDNREHWTGQNAPLPIIKIYVYRKGVSGESISLEFTSAKPWTVERAQEKVADELEELFKIRSDLFRSPRRISVE